MSPVLMEICSKAVSRPNYARRSAPSRSLRCVSYPTITALPETPDLAILAAPAETVAPAIAELGARGTRAAIVLAPDLDRSMKEGEPTIGATVRAVAAMTGVRLWAQAVSACWYPEQA